MEANASIPAHVFVLFGATGDLARRKLMPALFLLWRKDVLPKGFRLLCVGRRDLTKEGYLTYIGFSKLPGTEKELARFSRLLRYERIDFAEQDQPHLRKVIAELDAGSGHADNIVSYLAMPPELFSDVLAILKANGFVRGKGFRRVVFEKPFGSDGKSAKALNDEVTAVFSERQIYRIDHYLGKELVQNILVFRFANSVFEQIWNRDFVDHMQITVAERIGIGTRAGYYEQAGAVRDMLQNHLLQVLALSAMEAPRSLDPERIRDEKQKVFSSLLPVRKEDIVVGQYAGGSVDGEKVAGYREEQGVEKRSGVETYVAAKLSIGMPRWEGVPFYLRTGKRMGAQYAEVDLVLKDVAARLFSTDRVCNAWPNIITIRIQPDEGISIRFNAKVPGPGMHLQPVRMDFCHACEFGINSSAAYETLLQGVMLGDQTLFARWDSVDASWAFIDRLRKVMPGVVPYRAGTMGPKGADLLLSRDHRSWVQPRTNGSGGSR